MVSFSNEQPLALIAELVETELDLFISGINGKYIVYTFWTR
jgi:hypothetical protein